MKSYLGALVLIPLFSVIACDFDLFGPDAPTTRFNIRGTVTFSEGGGPAEAAKVFLVSQGWVVSSGGIIKSDTVATNAEGFYQLETKYYCPARVLARLDGYWMTNAHVVSCEDAARPVAVDIVLEPLPQSVPTAEPQSGRPPTLGRPDRRLDPTRRPA
jgi:hypothetical protein